MQSLQSRLLIFAIENSHLLPFMPKRTTRVDWNTSIPDLRQEVDLSSSRMGKLPAGIEVSGVQIGTLSAEWVIPSQTPRDKAILYFHGGGYVTGSSRAHRSIVAKFVVGSGVGALVMDYRLAPEHTYPAALDDALAAYGWLLEQGISPSRIVFVGDSAGAGLCLAALLAVRDQGIPLPAAAVALSPWTDLKNTDESKMTNYKRDKICWRGSQEVFSKYYAGDHDPALPYISPLFGDLAGLPPMRLYVGGHELMLDEVVQYAEKAKAAGVDVKLTIGEGLFHCYPAVAPLFPEATQAMDEICAFIRQRLNG